MSVLVNGMEMPANCGECPMICEDDLCHITKGGRTINERPPHCPLIEVPPHGRLIDADALIDSMFDNLVAKTMMFGGQYVYTKVEIESAPTIIEAEGEET